MNAHKRMQALRLLAVLAAVYTAVQVAAHRLGNPAIGIDDANIFFVYARHLADGHGLVYNVGGETVEGYSSLLWVMVCTLFYRFWPMFETGLLAFLMCLTACSLTAFVTRIHTRFTPADPASPPLLFSPPATVALLWLFCTPAFIIWSTLTLMDTGLWMSLLLGAGLLTERFARLSRRRGRDFLMQGLMMALLIVTRPEAPAWILALSAAAALAIHQRTGAWRPALRAALPGLAGGLVALLLLTAFRLAYFGYPLPNTYYAKVSPDRWYNISSGLQYAGAFLASGGVVAAGALVAICHLARLLIPRVRKVNPGDTDTLVTVASVMVITGIVIPVLVGGDHFGAFRFYQPVWPWLIVPLLPLLQPLFQRVTKPVCTAPVRLLAMLPLVVFLAFDTEMDWVRFRRLNLLHEFSIPVEGRDHGRYLNFLFEDAPPPSVGVIAAGGIKFTCSGPVIDLLGLNNVAMAHHEGDRRGFKNHAGFSRTVFLQQRPDIVRPRLVHSLPAENPFREDHFGNAVLRRVFLDPEVQSLYTVTAFRRQDRPDLPWLVCYAANACLARLRSDSRYTVHTLAHAPSDNTAPQHPPSS